MESRVQKSLELLDYNDIVTSRQWANLSAEDKNSFPKGLKTILERACKSEGNSNNTRFAADSLLTDLDEYFYTTKSQKLSSLYNSRSVRIENFVL